MSNPRLPSPTALAVRSAIIHAKAKSAILIDDSGSMGENDGQTLSRRDRATAALRALWARRDDRVQLWRYNRIATQFDNPDQTPGVGYSTNTERALRAVAAAGARHIVLITDGCPTEPDDSANAAVQLGVVVDVLFVGDPNDEDAKQFCRNLAWRTRGHSTDQSVEPTQHALTETLQKYLPEPKGA